MLKFKKFFQNKGIKMRLLQSIYESEQKDSDINIDLKDFKEFLGIG